MCIPLVNVSRCQCVCVCVCVFVECVWPTCLLCQCHILNVSVCMCVCACRVCMANVSLVSVSHIEFVVLLSIYQGVCLCVCQCVSSVYGQCVSVSHIECVFFLSMYRGVTVYMPTCVSCVTFTYPTCFWCQYSNMSVCVHICICIVYDYMLQCICHIDIYIIYTLTRMSHVTCPDGYLFSYR